MTGSEILDSILPVWRAALPASISSAYFDGFVRRNRPEIERMFEETFGSAEAAAKPASTTEPLDLQAPPDEWTPARRASANLAAMEIAATKDPLKITAEDRKTLLGYSGWGGLSIEKYRDRFPAGWDPDAFGLVHEFYTPTKVARAVASALCEFLPGLVGRDGVLRALEPSAGIGRFMLAIDQVSCDHPPIDWTAIELSKIAGTMLPLLFPEALVSATSFEEWLHLQTGQKSKGRGKDVESSPAGKFRLVVSNPPYGKRGVTAKFDQAPEYMEPEAFAYFLRRGLDLLAPSGIGVFLIPAGFMTGASRRPLREKVLLRHHLMSAFRMPSTIFPGANLVTDLLFFRARGGELAEVDEGDQFILDGRYFAEFPTHVLGEEVGRGGEDDLDRPQGRHRHQVLGEFSGLPPLVERPTCVACIVRPSKFAPATASRLLRRTDTDELTPLLAAAVSIGARVGDYLAERAEGSARALALWPELVRSLEDWVRAPEVMRQGVQNPWVWMDLRALVDQGNADAGHFLGAFLKTGTLTDAITTKPEIEVRYRGEAGDVLGQADYLYRSRRGLTLDALLEFHQGQGGALDRRTVLRTLLAADWCLDADELVPLADYVAGELWPKLDRLDQRAPGPDLDRAQIDRQRDRLIKAIAPMEFEDLGPISPGSGYLDLGLVSEYVSEVLNGDFGAIRLERDRGLLVPAGEEYARLDTRALTDETIKFVAWRNHDKSFFDPKDLHPADPERDELRPKFGLGELGPWDFRRSYERGWTVTFNAWLHADPSRMAEVRDAYNRTYRGFVPRVFAGDGLDIARWGGQVTLQPHQNAAARRILDRRGGLLAFDVGVGKTYTGLGILARARQDGWGRRPVVLVPVSLVWKWYCDFQRCLPDYRVAVIGAKRGKLTRGPRFKDAADRLARGEITREQFESLIIKSEADTPEERAQKWQAFQAGLYDAVILSYSALDSTAVDLDTILHYAEGTPAIRRAVSLRERNEKRRKTKPKKATERKKAIAEATVKALVVDKLERDDRTPVDPGVRWEDLGIDLLIVDEAQNFKNLYAPEPREGGIPKYMGLPPEGSKRAWQLDFRASFVRRRTGGSGVVLLSATPAKNSPLEFYNILQYIDHEAFVKIGIPDPEVFIDRYFKIETREVLDTNFEVTRKSAVVGFQRLDELRDVLDRYAEFKTAEEVGIKLPKPRVQRCTVQMDYAQEAKYDVMVENITKRLESLLKGEGADSKGILGEMVRMSLVALHADLDEGYDWETALQGGTARRTIPLTALPRRLEQGWHVVSQDRDKDQALIERELPRPDYHSPKFDALAERIVATPDCGHIIFCSPLACHRWIMEVLVEAGIPRERIAILNATVAAAVRVKIADDFNGDEEAGRPPLYDVIIANEVAHEGVDLQVRTCAIHHIDLPWTPADLEQRNGRAYRQGNILGTIEIIYYIARGSMDGYRFATIHGKRGWLANLLESQDRDTNNPAAQEDFSPEDLLRYIARDPAKFDKLLARRREQQQAQARQKIAENASTVLRQAVGRFREARRIGTADPERAAQLRHEAQQRLTDLEHVSADAWPWGRWMGAFRDVDGLVPGDGSAPVYEGLRVSRGDEDRPDAFEFGQVVESTLGLKIGMRRAGEADWRLVDAGEVAGLRIRPEDLMRIEWPAGEAEETDAAISARIARLDGWQSLAWEGASEAFREQWWARRGKAIVERLARRAIEGERLPVIVAEGLALRSGPGLRDGDTLPPTSAGWERYLQLAPQSGEPFSALQSVGLLYWGRKIPRDLLARALREEDEESALRRLQRELGQARDALAQRPRDLLQWLEGEELERAVGVLEAYLDEPTRSLVDFLESLREALEDDLAGRFYAHTPTRGKIDDDEVVEDGKRRYVIASAPNQPVRRIYVERRPGLPGEPVTYSIVEGELQSGDRIWSLGIETIEEAWRRYAQLARALELAPAYLGEAGDLLILAGEAIDTPLCQGKERKEATLALRLAKKYFDRARERVLMGRPARALEALRQLVDRLAVTAGAIAQACEAGQQTLAPTEVVVPAVDRDAVVAVGEDIVDDEDVEHSGETIEAEATTTEDEDLEREEPAEATQKPRRRPRAAAAAMASAALEVFD